MTLTAGMRLGPHEILSPLGAGGMGEVYRARDTRLDRIVAIKVLPQHLARDPERRARFEREARAVSALNHPHICTLHDIGEQDGVDYLVLEYLEGEPLADRLAKGPLPLHQALRCASEVADALDKAHRHGIVHRDLKPGNVVLTRSGAKLLDFGLAKLKQDPAELTGASAVATEARPLTEKGTLLGTYQYMAPEQLEGEEADARTDLFTLGSVLYEMVTGRRAFEGKSRASLVAAILEKQPQPISALQPMTPPALDRLVTRCLAKDPDERWQCAGDLGAELKRIAREPEESATAFQPRLRWPAILGLAAGCLLLGGLAGSLLPRRALPTRETAGVAQRLSVTLPLGTRLSLSTSSGTLALSPDGRQIAFVGFRSGVTNLYLRSLADLEARLVPGTQGATTPFFSPDGQWLGFLAEGKLKKIAIPGGQPVTLCDAPDARGASWADDGAILFVPTTFAGLSRVAADGGTPEAITRLDPEAGAGGDRWPCVLPGGKAALFSRIRSWSDEGRDIAAVSLASREVKLLVKGASYPRYWDGILFYARGGSILARPFDTERLAVSGPEVVILDEVKMFPRDSGSALFQVASTGAAAFVPGSARAVDRTLVWFDRAGHMQPVAAPPRGYAAPTIAPDGRRIAVVVEGPSHNDIWVGDPERDSWMRLTFEGDNRDPVWSPDGSRVAFQSIRQGAPNVYWARVDGSGGATPLTQGNSWYVTPRAFSPDGKEIAVNAFMAGPTAQDVWTVGIAEGSQPKPMIATPAGEAAGAFSPDGLWFAYTSNETGMNEVYLRSYPEGGKKRVVSRGGGSGLAGRRGAGKSST